MQISSDADFKKASRCQKGECVEIKIDSTEVSVRSTLQPNTVLKFSYDEWSTFTDAVKDCEFDAPQLSRLSASS